MVNLYLVLSLDIHVHDNLIGSTGIVSLYNVYFGVFVTLFRKIPSSQNLSTVNHVGSQLIVFHQSYLFLQVVLLVLPHTVEVDFRDARTLCQLNVEITGVADEAVDTDCHVAEQTVSPVTFHCFCYLFARNLYLLPFSQSAQTNKETFVVVLHAVNGDCTDVVLPWCAAIIDFGSHFALYYLREHRKQQSEET